MNDKQFGLIIGTIITSVITIPTIYISGRKSYKMGVKHGSEINQGLNNICKDIQKMLNDKKED